jgi:hypothetical protein
MAYTRKLKNKDLQAVVTYATKNGFVVIKSGGGHIKLKLGKVAVLISNSPSCPYAHKNALRDVNKIMKEHNGRTN